MLIGAFALTGGASPASAQGVTAERKTARAVRVRDNAIRLDGRLDDEAWADASAITDFVQKEPTEGAAPGERTEVRFVYDGSALYVGARMYSQSPASIEAPMGRRDNVDTQAENIIVSFDTFLDRRTAYSFGVTASGVRLDRFHRLDDEETLEAGFDPVWEAKSRIDEQGWTAEMWIPFAQLRFNNVPEQVWGLNVRRFIPHLEEQDYWMLVPRTERAWASRFGDLRGISGIRSTQRVELLPFLVGSNTVDSRAAAGDPFHRGNNLASRVGLDAKMGLGPNLTLQATLNPDFGQVEADPAEVNLSALPTRFAEKRPFFVEDAELLNLVSNTNFFYSRRIGGRPTGPAVGDYVDYPAGTTILGAAKLTGRVRPRTSLGMLVAVTAEEQARVANGDALVISRPRVTVPATYFLARVQQEFGRRGSTASIMTNGVHRYVDASDPLAALLARDAFAVAGDTLLRFKEGEYELLAGGGATYVGGEAPAIQRVQLAPAHYAQRPDRTYDLFDPARTTFPGYSYKVELNRISGRHWIFGGTFKEDSPGFETNDFANLSFADGIQPTLTVRYRETLPGRVFRNYSLVMAEQGEWNHEWNQQSFYSRPSVNLTWKNFWTTAWSASFNRRTQSATLTRGGPRMQTPGGWTTTATLGNRAGAQTRWSGSSTIARDEDGGRTSRVNGSLSFRPGPRWQLGITPLYERLVYTQQYVTTRADGRPATYGNRYIFANIERSTFSTQYRLNFTLKPDMNVDVYAEPFATSGRYSDYGELLVPDTRQRLTYGTAGTSVARLADGSLLISPGGPSFSLANRDFQTRSFRSTVVMRYEWRPGSTFYLVWQQDRSALDAIGRRVSAGDMFRSITAPGQNVLLTKMSFWLPVR